MQLSRNLPVRLLNGSSRPGPGVTDRHIDREGKARIHARIKSAEHGNFSDCEHVGERVSERRILFGPGYGACQ